MNREEKGEEGGTGRRREYRKEEQGVGGRRRRGEQVGEESIERRNME